MHRRWGILPLFVMIGMTVVFFIIYLHSSDGIPFVNPILKLITPEDDQLFQMDTLPLNFREKPVINPHNYNYILNPTEACSGEVNVIICVPVARHEESARRTVSETWGIYARNISHKAILIFFIGNGTVGESPDIQKGIEKEYRLYQDIVQEDFIDSYRNLTVKTMSIMKWVGTYCRHARYVIKADADIYVNVEFLLKTLQDKQFQHEKMIKPLLVNWNIREPNTTRGPDPRHFIMGVGINGAKPRRSDSKWAATVEEFPGNVYPYYLSGPCYSMPGITARYLHQLSLRTKFFWLEDIYTTGICGTAGNITRINNPTQHLSRVKKLDDCTFKNIGSSHSYTEEEIRAIHKDVTSPVCAAKP